MVNISKLWECETCKSIISREKINGVCCDCGKRTCIHCKRVCERCQRIFCMYHVETREVWRNDKMTRIMLCDRCNKVWTWRI